MRLFKSMMILLFIVAVTLFAVQNMEVVKLSFLNWYLEIPLSFASIILYILGAISGGMVFSILRKMSFEGSGKKKSYK
ncbi:MAG: hypothetical protein ACK4ND_15395 [Cytophagaceae bacterium]